MKDWLSSVRENKGVKEEMGYGKVSGPLEDFTQIQKYVFHY